MSVELDKHSRIKDLVRHKSYTLSPAERILAQIVGEARHTRARAKGIPDARAAEDATYIDVNGAAGEIALAGLLYRQGIYTKATWEEALHTIAEAQDVSAAQGTDNGDLLVEGLRIDVKTTHYSNGVLWLHARKLQSPIDYYSLMVGDYKDGSFIYRGSLSAQDVRAKFYALDGQFEQNSLKELPFISLEASREALDYFNK